MHFAAAVLLGAVCVVGLFAWQAQQQRLAQDPKLQKALTDLHKWNQRTEAALTIRRTGAAAVAPLIQSLGDKDPSFIAAVQELLAATGKPAVTPLRDLLKSKDRLLQLRAIQTLNLMGAEATPAIPDLLPVLQQAGAPRGRRGSDLARLGRAAQHKPAGKLEFTLPADRGVWVLGLRDVARQPARRFQHLLQPLDRRGSDLAARRRAGEHEPCRRGKVGVSPDRSVGVRGLRDVAGLPQRRL